MLLSRTQATLVCLRARWRLRYVKRMSEWGNPGPTQRIVFRSFVSSVSGARVEMKRRSELGEAGKAGEREQNKEANRSVGE